MSWQLIDTAPLDGTIILLTDGVLFAAGKREFRIELDWKYRGYNEQGDMDDTFLERISNPNAGKRIEWWQCFGCSAFEFETNTNDYDGPLWFDPTHWAPMLLPPVTKG